MVVGSTEILGDGQHAGSYRSRLKIMRVRVGDFMKSASGVVSNAACMSGRFLTKPFWKKKVADILKVLYLCRARSDDRIGAARRDFLLEGGFGILFIDFLSPPSRWKCRARLPSP